MKQIFLLASLSIVILAFQNCGQGGSPTDPGKNGAADKISAAELYPFVANNVDIENMGNGEIIVSLGNFSFEDVNEDGENDRHFQIAISKDNGVTYSTLVPDIYDASTLIPETKNAYPAGIIYSESTILQKVRYYPLVGGDAVTVVLIIDRSNLSHRTVEMPNCSIGDGIQQQDGSWLFAGRCNDLMAVFKTDEDLGNLQVIDSVDQGGTYGGSHRSLIQASDNCLYAGGYAWGGDPIAASGTHMIVRRSCDQGDSWQTDYEYNIAGSAYSSVNGLFEHNGTLFAYGNRMIDGENETVMASILRRNSDGSWTATNIPNSSMRSSSPIGTIKAMPGTCNMVAVTRNSTRDLLLGFSTDCGNTWGNFSPPIDDFYFQSLTIDADGAYTMYGQYGRFVSYSGNISE